MDSERISRRNFARIAGGLAAAGLPLQGAAAPTADEVIKQIREGLGGEWPANGIEGLKAGSPDTPVKGIATTAMATVEVLRQAVKAGTNMVISYEPTFFGSRDTVSAPPAPGQQAGGRGFGSALNTDDPVYKAKKEFIDKNNLVIFRLRDHWRTKDGQMVNGLADALGWSARRVPGDLAIYEVPSSTLADTVTAVKKKLNLKAGLRAVGDPKTKVSLVMLCPGAIAIDVMWNNYDKVDLLLAGEIREWECSPYAVDVVSAGQKRGLVTVGRVVSEDPGMRACAAWLKTVVKNIPVQFIPAGDPYWRAS